MGVRVALEALHAPVAHDALLPPRGTLGTVADGADEAVLRLRPRHPVDGVRRADLRVQAEGDAARQRYQFEVVEDRAVGLVVDDGRAELPAHLLPPMVAGVAVGVPDGTGLRVAHDPLVVAPHEVSRPVLREPRQCADEGVPDLLLEIDLKSY